MVMYGAETEELDRIASEMVLVANDLDAGAKGLTSVVSAVAWLGEAAAAYLQDWTGIKIPRLYLTTQFLRDAAVELRHQAREQRLASDRWGDAYVKDAGWNTREAIAAGLDDALVGIRHASPEAQQAWWDSLTDAEREALLRNRSEDIMVLDGLPRDVTDAAQKYWEDEVAPSMVVTSVTEVNGELQAGVKLIELIGAGSLTMTRYADGSIDLQGDGSLGVGVDGLWASASTTVDGGLGLHFESQDEFDEFVHDLIVAETHSNPVLRQLARAELIAEHASTLETVSVGRTYEASFLDASASAAFGGELNIPNQTLTGFGSVHVGSDTIGALDVSAAVTVGLDGTPQSVSIEANGSLNAISLGLEGMVKDSPVTFDAGLDARGSARIELDLTDPEVRAFVPSILSAAGRGDPGEIWNQMVNLGDRVEVQVAAGWQAEASVGVDLQAISISGGVEYSQNEYVWIRPANGHFINVSPDRLNGGR